MEADVSFRRGDYSPLVLAYLGDAFFETLTRASLIGSGDCKTSELNRRAKAFVTAEAQSGLADRLMPFLNEEELAVYKSGRNAKSAHRSRSASVLDYRRATGFESLFGYLWISGKTDRAKELFNLCVKGTERDGRTE